MARRRSVASLWDARALRQLVEGEGVDTRTWCAVARIDSDSDAIRWDSELGWIVDVTIQGGPLDQTGPIACRLACSFVADGGVRADPPTTGALVVVALGSGSLNDTVIVVGVLPTPDLAAPTTVNGISIDSDMAERTHVFVTPHDVQQEVGEKWRTSATSRATLEAPEVRLADDDADQAFVRGDAQKDGFSSFLDAFDTWANLVKAQCAANTPPINIETTQILAASAQLRVDLAHALSTKIKGA